MLINNSLLLARIETQGFDAVINEINAELIEDDLIKIIVRTIQHSKNTLLETLEKKMIEQTLVQQSDKTIA